MSAITRRLLCLGLLGLAPAGVAHGMGPIDAEVSTFWWVNDYEMSGEAGNQSESAAAPGMRAELWAFKRYGLEASRFDSDPEDFDGATYTSVDVMWKALAPTENNFMAVGLGWQKMDIDALAAETSGMRVMLEGRVGFAGMLYGYGRGAYLPELDESDAEFPTFGRLEDLDAYEYELGIAWNAMPFLNVHAGYRVDNLSFTHTGFTTLSVPAGSFTAVGGGGGATGIANGPGQGCPGCATQATGDDGLSGETESAGFFLGVGLSF